MKPHCLQLIIALSLVLCAHGAQSRPGRVYQCVDRNGNKVFQDKSCRSGEAANAQSKSELTRWSAVRRSRGTCAMRSPVVGVSYLSNMASADDGTQATPIALEGGVALILRANDSGVAAEIVIDAHWPNQAVVQANTEPANTSTVSATPEQSANPPSPETSATQQQIVNDQTTAASTGPSDVQASSARRVELAPNIAAQGIWAVNTGLMAVDSMNDATRLAFGFGQSRNVFKALAGASEFELRLMSRNPQLTLRSSPLEVKALQTAIHSVRNCVENPPARTRLKD